MPTMMAKVRVHRVASTPRPATISMTPTMYMKVRPLNGSIDANAGAMYFDQSTSKLVNLSRPATMGTIPNTSFKVAKTLLAVVVSRVRSAASDMTTSISKPTMFESVSGMGSPERPRRRAVARR